LKLYKKQAKQVGFFGECQSKRPTIRLLVTIDSHPRECSHEIGRRNTTKAWAFRKPESVIACKGLTFQVEADEISLFELHLIFEQLNP
jgi:hypothetical protein